MTGSNNSVDPGTIAQAGQDVQDLVNSPGWTVLQDKLDRYKDSQVASMLGGASEEVSKYAFTCGRVRAVEDFRALVNETIAAGKNAEQERKRQENT